VKSVYKLKNSVTDKYIYNADGSIKTQEFTGTGNCTFKATNADFQIKLISSDDFPGHSELIFGLGENGEIQAWSIDGQTQYTVVSSSATPTNIITVAGSAFQVYSKVQSATIKIKAKDGNKDLGEEEITISVIAPSDIYLIDEPNFTGYWHIKNTYSLVKYGRYLVAPFTVSFHNIKIQEWGDLTQGNKPGYAKYIGDSDKEKNYWAARGMINTYHKPTGRFVNIMSCKGTYETTRGKLVNVVETYDMIGYASLINPFSIPEPRTGANYLRLLIRYQVQVDGYEANCSNPVNYSATINKEGQKYKIAITKRNVEPKMIETDSENSSFIEVIPKPLSLP
jgi:hypothetical protein